MNGPLFYPGKNHGHLNGRTFLPEAVDDAPRRTLLPRVNRRAINLRRFRKSRCMSAPQFSAKTGIGVSSILDMEGGRHAITVKTMDRIADAFELRTADLSRPFRREPRQIGLFGEGLAAQ